MVPSKTYGITITYYTVFTVPYSNDSQGPVKPRESQLHTTLPLQCFTAMTVLMVPSET